MREKNGNNGDAMSVEKTEDYRTRGSPQQELRGALTGGKAERRPEDLPRVLSWRSWVGALVVAVLVAGAAQVLLYLVSLRTEPVQRHVISGAFHAVVILIPVGLFLAWRRTARMERYLRAKLQKAVELRDDLTDMLVHDLKNPTIAAGMALGSLRTKAEEKTLGDEETDELLEVARKSCRRVENMIGDLLTLARGESGRLQLNYTTFDLTKVLRNQASAFRHRAEEESVAFDIDIRQETLSLEGDAHLLRRAVDNLLENALNHTPAGGRIDLAVERDESEITITVADTGRGISEEHQERIFEKFGQVEGEREGSSLSVGLGLVLCRLVAEAHGGRIWVKSAPGEGSKFSIALPLVHE
ncbi:MAG: hypothetical protein GF400_01270 [Candidatus Eisenbacteria bacterium]|nr:hypothetical protein [Candidatus Eisenbacteria bacterium]